jgi:hypothetical protein
MATQITEPMAGCCVEHSEVQFMFQHVAWHQEQPTHISMLEGPTNLEINTDRRGRRLRVELIITVSSQHCAQVSNLTNSPLC